METLVKRHAPSKRNRLSAGEIREERDIGIL
jgi:hypothetical protein